MNANDVLLVRVGWAGRVGESGRMTRAERHRVALETDEIVAAGGYEADGPVDLSGMLTSAREGTHLHLPDEAEPGVEDDVAPDSRGRLGSDMTVDVTRETTLAAAHRIHRETSAAGRANGDGVACLNFASATKAGGGYRSGAQAQEESLARASGLAACLEQVPAFYDFHRRQKHPIYSDRVICSPGVPVFRNDDGGLLPEPYPVTFLTAAAPNAGALEERGWQGDLEGILHSRARRVLAIAAAHGHSHLVLGAWGCGVFRNDPDTVAAVFADLLDSPFAGSFAQVTFAVFDPQPQAPTFRTFHETLHDLRR